MGIEQNKRVVTVFLEKLPNDPDQALELMAHDGLWEATYANPDFSSMSGFKNKTQLLAMYHDIGSLLQNLEFSIKGLTAEENRVAAQVQTKSNLPNGNPYNNIYHMLFEIKNGKIKTVREYSDTLYAEKVLGEFTSQL